MKTKILILAILLSGCFAPENMQDLNLKVQVPMEDGKVQFTKEGIVDSVGKDELYSRGLEWIDKTFVSSKSVLQFQDAFLGKIVGSGVYEMPVMPHTPSIRQDDCKMFYSFSIYVNKGKYRCTVTGINFEVTIGNDEHQQTIPVTAEESITPDAISSGKPFRAKFKVKLRDTTISYVNALFESFENGMNTKRTPVLK